MLLDIQHKNCIINIFISRYTIYLRDNCYPSLCMRRALWMNLKSSFMLHSRHRANFPVASASLRIHLNAWWSVFIVTRAPSKVRSLQNSSSESSKALLVCNIEVPLLRTWRSWPISDWSVLPSSYIWSKSQLTWKSHSQFPLSIDLLFEKFWK